RVYVDCLKDRLTLHLLPGDAQVLNPDELVWSYTKRTGVARSPLRSGEKLADRVHDQLSDIAVRPELVRSFFRHPSVAYISDL
ncbi:DDE endonuclease, partial [Xanthomonas oryzae pv. oryzae]